MKITHSYEGLGEHYRKARNGTPRFAQIMISLAFEKEIKFERNLNLVELGIGSGQQTEFVEHELINRGITDYHIAAFDNAASQLDVLQQRMQKGEISNNIIPEKLDFDNNPLPVETESIDISYMSHVYHHLSNRKQVFGEIFRITKKGGSFFLLGVVLEDMVNHPLDEFFPEKFEYEKRRYANEDQLEYLFTGAGFTFEKPVRIKETVAVPLDRDFLESIINTSQDSTLTIIREEDPEVFNRGVARVRREVKKGEEVGKYRTYYYGGRLKVFRGIRQ
ncbi:MAG: methyltransferase domain-containing protein [Dehalococcoidales bacterium]|nr:methyltransferase domain-containing protein [Dehalococcoidales bacterium]